MEQTTQPSEEKTEQDINEAGEVEASENRTHNNMLNRESSTPESETNPEAKTTSEDRPDYWPEEYWDSEKGQPKLKEFQDKYTKTEKAVEDLRRIISQKESKKTQAETPEAYEFEALTEDFKGNKQDIDLFSTAAKEAGLNNQQANTVLNKFLEQQDALNSSSIEAETEKLGPQGEQMLVGINNFINARVQNKTFSQQEGDAFADLITTADSARAISKIIEMTGELAIPTSVRMSSENKSPADVRRAMVEAFRSKDGQMNFNKDNEEIRKLRQEAQSFNR